MMTDTETPTFEDVKKMIGADPADLQGHEQRVQEIIDTYPSKLLKETMSEQTRGSNN